MRTLSCFFVLLLAITSCDKNNKGPDQENDPWSELRDIGPGEVKIDGNYMCFYDCFYDKIDCGTRQILECDISQLHPDWFAYDCYVITDFQEDNNEDYYYAEGEDFGDLFYLVCLCGRSGNTFSNYYTIAINTFKSCDDMYTVSPRDDGFGNLWDGDCGEDRCNPCISNCDGRECGPNGCGESCGTCPPGKKCSTAGICIDADTGDPCSTCLASCRGLPGCCTGCGCICEDACGGCF
jgi:hypothetical protein